MSKIVWLDLETTGINPKLNGILEIGAIMEIDGQKVDTFQTYMRPDASLVIEPEALGVNGIDPDRIEEFPPEEDALAAFQRWLGKYINKFDKQDKALIGGFNVHFDIDFLMALWTRNGDKYFGSWFRYHPVDLRAFSAFHLRDKWNQLPDGKLMTVTRAILGESRVDAILSEGATHSALTAIGATREAFHALMGVYE